MLYKKYGKLGFKVSAVGFGGMQFDLKKSNAKNAELLQYAFDQGINYFDTAPVYCEEQSETIFGMGLPKIPREKYLVTTKCFPKNSQTFTQTEKAVKDSLKKMRCDYIDFYHVWCLKTMDEYDLAMKKGGQYESLLKLQEQGLIKNIVVSSHQPSSEIKQVIAKNKFGGILLGANILNFPYRWDGIVAAHQAGMAVVAMNPLAGGTIPRHEKALAFLATDGLTATESALRFLICCPQITITLNGFTTRAHIDTACKVADRAKPFSEAEIKQVTTNIGEHFNAICTGCGYCLDCPKNINIPAFMLFYNQKQMFHTPDKKMRELLSDDLKWWMLAGRENELGKCIACGKCEKLCTQRLPIISRLKEIAAWQK